MKEVCVNHDRKQINDFSPSEDYPHQYTAAHREKTNFPHVQGKYLNAQELSSLTV